MYVLALNLSRPESLDGNLPSCIGPFETIEAAQNYRAMLLQRPQLAYDAVRMTSPEDGRLYAALRER